MPPSSCPCRVHSYNNVPTPFRFFALPPEIRNEIMILAITETATITIHSKPFNRHPKPQQKTPAGHIINRSQQPSVEKLTTGHSRIAILMTCRQAYYDGSTLYYGKNTFSFTLKTLRAFCEDIPRRCLSQIRSVIIMVPFMDRHDTIWRTLAGLEALEDLELQMRYPRSTVRRLNWENCIWGARGIRRLKRFRITRYDPESELSRRESVALHETAIDAKDRSAEEEINRYARHGISQPLSLPSYCG